MKNSRLSFVVPLLVLSLAACTQEKAPSPVQQNVRLYALDANLTKTTMDPASYTVAWSAEDKLSVFNAPAGTTGYSGNLEFCLDDAETGLFRPASGVVVPFEDGVQYDWKVFYPFMGGLSSPDAAIAIPQDQTQSGRNNVTHLAGYDILHGEASATRSPNVAMLHLGTLMCWTVKNNYSKAFTVQKIAFDNGVKTYELTVDGDTDLAPGASANYYMVADPFSFSAGDDLTLTITTSIGADTQTRHFTSAKSFPAGSYNTATIKCSPTEPAATFTVAKNAGGRWRLYKNGEEFFMNGVAANRFYDKVAEFGGNVIRTYNTSQIAQALDEANATGAYVLVGLPLGRERDGFDFGNTAAIAAQKESTLALVGTYASHPAVLGWILGNELDSSYTDPRVWDVVGDLAAAVKAADPNHLTTTALAGAKNSALVEIKNQAAALDFISINSYYPSTSNTYSALNTAGWSKPWILSEFGPRGTWNITASSNPPLTSWGACVEQTSTQKAAIYKSILEDVVIANKDNGCIGSCAFVWGYQTSGAVISWYGLFSPEGYSLPAVDELQYIWTGSYPSYRAPEITNRHSLVMDGSMIADDSIVIPPSTSHTASVTATSLNNGPMTYKWRVMAEGTSSWTGIGGLIDNDSLASITFTSPSNAGAYRLVVFVTEEGAEKTASASIPFYVANDGVGVTPGSWTQGNDDFMQ